MFDNEYWGVIRVVGDFVIDFGCVMKNNFIVSNGKDGVDLVEFKYDLVDVSNNIIVSFIFVF